jgi:hypothetical protein
MRCVRMAGRIRYSLGMTRLLRNTLKWVFLPFILVFSGVTHMSRTDGIYVDLTTCTIMPTSVELHSKVLLNGVTRKDMRGLPKCVLQEEKKKRSDVIAAHGTVQAAVLKMTAYFRTLWLLVSMT